MSQRESEAGSAFSQVAAANSAASSGMVMSAFSATFSKRNARCGSSLAWRHPPLGLGARLPRTRKAFTRLTTKETDTLKCAVAGLPAHSLALRPAHSRRHLYVTSYTEGFSHFVTSMTAPVASAAGAIWPGGARTHWKAPPCHGARKLRSLPTARRTGQVGPKGTSVAIVDTTCALTADSWTRAGPTGVQSRTPSWANERRTSATSLLCRIGKAWTAR